MAMGDIGFNSCVFSEILNFGHPFYFSYFQSVFSFFRPYIYIYSIELTNARL